MSGPEREPAAEPIFFFDEDSCPLCLVHYDDHGPSCGEPSAEGGGSGAVSAEWADPDGGRHRITWNPSLIDRIRRGEL